MKVSLERVRFKRLSALRQLPTRSGLTSTEWVLAAYAGILISAAGALTGSLIASGIGIGSPYAVAALSFLALMAEKESIRLSPTVEVSVSSVIFIFAGVLFGPLAAIVVGAAGHGVTAGHGASSGATPNCDPPPPYTPDRGSCVCVPRRISVERRTVLHTSIRSPAAIPSLPRAEAYS